MRPDSGCLQELKILSDDANVYKLVGPALIKQDPIEAKANVSKRLEFIGSELERLDNQLKSLETKSNERQEEVWAFWSPVRKPVGVVCL